MNIDPALGVIQKSGIFDLVEISDSSIAEFPTSLLSSDNEVYCFSSNNFNSIDIVENVDYVNVPLCSLEHMDEEELQVEQYKLLVTAGTKRNLIVLDKDVNNNYFSSRLVALMKVCLRHNLNGSKLTHMFVPRNLNYAGTTINNIKVVGLSEYEYESICFKYELLGGVLPYNKSKLVIGADLSTIDGFVAPFSLTKEKLGLAVLESKRVILGAY